MFKSMSTHLVVIVAFAELAKGGGSLLVKRTMELAARQALEPSNIPSQCDSICAPIFSDDQRCGTLNSACLCTSSVRNDGINCANCVASIFPSELDTLQRVADASVQGCAQHGFPIDPIKLTGISPSGGGSVSAVGSNTATGSPAGSNTAAGSVSPSSTTTTSASGGGGSTKTGGGVHAIRLSLPSLAVALGVGVAYILL